MIDESSIRDKYVHTFEIAHEKPLIGNEFVRHPFVLLAIEPHARSQTDLVRRATRDPARDQEEVVQHGVRVSVLFYPATCCFELLECWIGLEREDGLADSAAAIVRTVWLEVHDDLVRLAFGLFGICNHLNSPGQTALFIYLAQSAVPESYGSQEPIQEIQSDQRNAPE